MKRRGLVGLALMLLVSSNVVAQNVKPADVLVIAETVNMRLEQLFAAQLKAIPKTTARNQVRKLPRHVYRKASDVFAKVQTLRLLNGLPKSKVAEIPNREVEPADVLVLLRRMETDVVAVMSSYWSVPAEISVKRRDNATPTDVYEMLDRASQLLDGLGLPTVVPNDVHLMARLLVEDLKKVYRARTGRAFNGNTNAPSRGKSPAMVFAKGYAIYERLANFAETLPEGAIKGGIVLPPKRDGRITPANVLELLSNIVAEISSLKVHSGADMGATSLDASAGMTPSNVFDKLEEADAILKALS